ncbi:hypothetical protein BS17DRAFT_772951 [Gyrodon lividus]|nr:hypothetical protein BS17DRAFT_772951 [Gyrodon lividus]
MIPSAFFTAAVAFSSFLAANAVALPRADSSVDWTPTDTATNTWPTTSYTPTTCCTPTPIPSDGTAYPTPTYEPTTYEPSSQPTYEPFSQSTYEPSSQPTYEPTYQSSYQPSPTGTWKRAINCNGVQPWQGNLAYSAGNTVIFNGKLYTANQWTYNNSPGTNPGQWTSNGDCAQPVNNKADCNGVATWQQSKAYSGGDKVVYNGHLWVAQQWTSSNTPGDLSGTWKDAGVCT